MVLHGAGNIDAIFFRHHLVENHRIGGVSFDEVERGFTVRSFDQPIGRIFQGHEKKGSEIFFIISDKNGFHTP